MVPNPLGRPHVGADARVVPHVREEVVLAEAGVPRRVRLGPEAVAVPAVQREDLACGQLRSAPCGRRPQRCGDARLACQLLEGEEVLGSVVELVLELDRDDRSARLRAAVEGGGELTEPLRHEREVGGIVRAVCDRLRLHPIGQAPVAHFAVRPRPDAQRDLEAGRRALVDERGNVELAVEARVSRQRDVVDPEHVGRGDRDAAGAQLPGALTPSGPRGAAVVQFARDRYPRGAVPDQRAIGDRKAQGALGRCGHGRASRRARPRLGPNGKGHHSTSCPRSGRARKRAVASVTASSSTIVTLFSPARVTGAGTNRVRWGPRRQ